MDLSPLHERLRQIVGTQSYRRLGELTLTNAETARRYMNGQPPSVEFLAAICRQYTVNGEWLLTGRGPMRVQEIRSHALREASASELLNAMAQTLERLTSRVERLELFVQTLETRLRAADRDGDGSMFNGRKDTPEDLSTEVKPSAIQPDADGGHPGTADGIRSAPQVEVRAEQIADAARRPRPTDD